MFRELRGWLAGCGVASTSIYVSVLVFMAIVSGQGVIMLLEGAFLLLPVALLIFAMTCVVTIVPAALVIRLSERFEMRSALFFGSAGAAIGALGQTLLFQTFVPISLLFVPAGGLAGIVYWHVAGKHGGRDRACAPP